MWERVGGHRATVISSRVAAADRVDQVREPAALHALSLNTFPRKWGSNLQCLFGVRISYPSMVGMMDGGGPLGGGGKPGGGTVMGNPARRAESSLTIQTEGKVDRKQ